VIPLAKVTVSLLILHTSFTIASLVMSYLNLSPLPHTFNRLEGKVIFVTGASSGIGAAAAKLFAAEGAKVVVAARRMEKLESVVSDIQSAGTKR